MKKNLYPLEIRLCKLSSEHHLLSKEDQLLIDRIKSKVEAGTITLMQEKHGREATLYPTVVHDEIMQVETQIGFQFPALVRELYVQVGNGGFGPGYGILGVSTSIPMDNSLEKWIDLWDYDLDILRTMLDDIPNDKRPVYFETLRRMQTGQICTYADWGCGVYTRIDFGDPELPVYTADGSPLLERHSSGNLRQWWSDWVDGRIKQY